MNEDRDIFLAANLGSEMARLWRAKNEQNAERMQGAYERACDIVKELRISTDSGGQAESAILQTILDDRMRSNPVFSISAESLNGYFLPFAHKILGV